MASTEPLSRIVHLANTIIASVTKIDESLRVKGLPSPSFDEDVSFNRPAEVAKDHDIVLDATAELHDLLLEPLNLIHRHGGHNNSLCMQAIAEFRIADMVPPYGRVSFGEIANRTPMTEQMTARILRHAMTMRIFCEPEPGMVAHTAASKLLNHSPANDWLQAGTQEMWPAATKMVEALQKWPASQEPNETGYSLSNNSTKSIYDIYAKDAERAARWARGMEVFSQRPQFDLSYVTDHYDWHSLGQAQVVDVGGSQGHVSIALARRFSNLQFTVQDMKQVVENATIPEGLQDRVQFMAHDLFAPQALKGVDVYFLRWVLHNWSYKYCIQILRALTPTIKPGARVLIQETLMPEPGTVAMWKEKNLRATDLNMAAAFNSQERTVAEFEALFRQADPSYVLRNVVEPAGSALGMLEFVWKGSVK
ncbi:S-adenosyl-L-methionine-dependent methyltransferase [Hypoxylon sp. NC1633]|nr:S-adenosyl-L-methionine-dependent methyltransferase [Hypoxylon sp. NC1633]